MASNESAESDEGAVEAHDGARDALEQRIATVGRLPVQLSITDNRHTMLHAQRREGVLRVRLHHMFLDAPVAVQEALARFLAFRDREASHTVGDYIDRNQSRIRILSPKRRRSAIGTVHNLQEIFAELNTEYFDGRVDAQVCWGGDLSSRKAGRTSIKLGSYSERERLVRVHPRLDQPFVPRFFVAFVLYHEMLHQQLPYTRQGHRRRLHSPEFRRREQDYRHYDNAVAWEQENLDRLLDSD